LAAVGDTPRLDAELLMAHGLGVEREELLLRGLDERAPAAFAALLERRLAHEPVAYITGRRAFWTIDLEVGPGVLVPRPDSETLLEAAVARFGERGPSRILDLGTGPGTLLLAALDQWPEATGLGVDASAKALAYARRNAKGRASFRLGDWGEELAESFDLILCNPPYVEAGADLPPDVARYEPAVALYAGADGLDAYRALAPQFARLLAPGGVVCLEIGAGQQDAVSALMAAAGFTIQSRDDLKGIARCLILSADIG
jgi:release factor glutamine methyltransferase